jgi:hypothetical protein
MLIKRRHINACDSTHYLLFIFIYIYLHFYILSRCQEYLSFRFQRSQYMCPFPRPNNRIWQIQLGVLKLFSWCRTIARDNGVIAFESFHKLFILKLILHSYKSFDGPSVNALGVRSRKLSNVGRSSDGWPKIYYLELLRDRHAKPLVPAAFEVFSTHQSANPPDNDINITQALSPKG